jgi:hypothetical protein
MMVFVPFLGRPSSHFETDNGHITYSISFTGSVGVQEHVASIFRVEEINHVNQHEADGNNDGFLLDLFFDLEGGGSMLLRND